MDSSLLIQEGIYVFIIHYSHNKQFASDLQYQVTTLYIPPSKSTIILLISQSAIKFDSLQVTMESPPPFREARIACAKEYRMLERTSF